MNFTKNIEKSLVHIDSFTKTISVLDGYKDKNIRVCYSGGSDSDDMLWLLKYMDYNIKAVFYDTGLEYKATWDHLDWMKSQGFDIDIIPAVRSIPISNKIYGHPFLSKFVSEMLSRLQKHNFNFQQDGLKEYEELINIFPKAKMAINWWCNKNGKGNRYNIDNNNLLKEFLIDNGLPFPVSNKCCDGAKKLPIKKYAKENNIDLMLLGIRKAEGGIRAGQYKNCFLQREETYSMYFPLFWWKNEDKLLFDAEMKIKHSNCYEVYGLKRTGCAGCPFGRNFEDELNVIEKYEPRLYKGINNIFAPSYECMKKYKIYQKENKR